MEIFNQTPFQFAPLAGRFNFPGHSLTLIVKGTFDLAPDGKAEPSDEQPFPTGDEFYPDDEDMKGPPRYESDFAFFKPRADLLLAGHCHAPGGKPVPSCKVRFQTGRHSRSLVVIGDRQWKGALGFREMSDPEPFTKLELRYENSYGGEDYKLNPVGKGHAKEETGSGDRIRPLPNIEDPENLITSPRSKPEPAGFSPLGKMWKGRHSKLGTYKKKWLNERWPWFAEDIDWSFFNAAPEPMQVEGYLEGNEELFLENLHPDHPQYRSRLPGLRVRAFLNRIKKAGSDDAGEAIFSEISMKLDTLWADMEAEKLTLVWRGVAEVSSEDYEDEVQHVFIMSEPLEQTPESLDQCHERFQAALAAEEEEAAETGEPDMASAAETVDVPGESEAVIPREELNKKVDAYTSTLFAKLGIDEKSLPSEVKGRFKQGQDRIMDLLAETDPQKKAAMDLENFQAQTSDALSKAGIDMNHLPPLSDKAKQEQVRMLKEFGIDDMSILQDPEMAKFLGMMGALMPKMGVDPENLAPLIEEAKKHLKKIGPIPGLPDDAVEAKAEPPPLTREQVLEKISKEETLAGENLSHLDLSNLEIQGIDFSGAALDGTVFKNAVLTGSIFTGASMKKAVLAGADLSEAILSIADLSEASLEKAILTDADLTEADLAGADLTGAILDHAILEKARLNGAILDQVHGDSAFISEADLTGARLRNADLPAADFSGCLLNGADFTGSNLKEASIEGAKCAGAIFRETDITELRASSKDTDLTGCSFTMASGPESMWQEVELSDADFSYARMQGSDFTKASMERVDLYASDMKFSRFVKADLKEAKLVGMNLFEGSLEKADLTGADLSGSNLYGAELLKAVTDRTVMKGANLKMTKLA